MFSGWLATAPVSSILPLSVRVPQAVFALRRHAFLTFRPRVTAMRFFLAGIMQGSHLAAVIHNQDYRERLTCLLKEHFPEAEIFDPLAEHRNSLEYDDERGRHVFMHHNQLSAEVDVLLAFVPEASMGTAIEMWQAHRAGRAVVTISPLTLNWTVRFLSHALYSTYEDFESAVTCGALRRQLDEILGARAAPPASS